MANPVHLSVPAEYAYARTVRMLAANLAVLSGMSVEGVEDIRMATEECFVWACATEPASCEIEFTVDEGLSAQFVLGSTIPADDDQTPEFAQLIMDAVCDDYTYDREHGLLSFLKRTDSADA